MTRSLRQRFCPGALVEYLLCARAAEDCSHLFFECQFAQMAWHATPTSALVTSTADSFWLSINRGAIATCVGIAIYLCHFVANLASLEQSSLQRSSPFSRRNLARLKGAHSFLAPRQSQLLRFWTSVTDYLFFVIKSMTTRGVPQGASYVFFFKKKKQNCLPSFMSHVLGDTGVTNPL